MGNEEKILELLSNIDKNVTELNHRVERMESRMERLEESQDEVRASVNRLVEWADECGYVVKFPLPQI